MKLPRFNSNEERAYVTEMVKLLEPSVPKGIEFDQVTQDVLSGISKNFTMSPTGKLAPT